MKSSFKSPRARLALALSLTLISLTSLWLYTSHNQTTNKIPPEVGQLADNQAQKTSFQEEQKPTTQPQTKITPTPHPATPSVSVSKTESDNTPKPRRLEFRDGRIVELDEDEEEEHDEVENHEEEEGERGFYSEERYLWEFNMTKDPATGRIPFKAAEKAAEAAQEQTAYQTRNRHRLRAASDFTVVPRGPNNLGGRTRAIGIDVRNGNIMMAGSVSSGVFRTTNGGTSWTRVAPIGQIHNVTAIAQDPRTGNQDTWYYGGGETSGNSTSLGSSYRGHGVWKSTDNGLTWSVLTSTQTLLEVFDNAFDYVHRLVVDPTNGNVYAAAGNTIQRSTDGGTTWTPVLGTFTGSVYTDIIVTPSGRLYAAFIGTDANEGVWTSTTGASGSWTKIAGTTAGVVSPTGWNATSTYGRVVLTYAPSTPNIVYALYWKGTTSNCTTPSPEGKLFKYDQTAGTWTDLSANMPDETGCLAGNDPFAVQTGYDLVVAVKPDDPNTVFLGGTNIYRSTSGFTNTTATTRIGGYNSPASYALYPNSHPDIHVLTFGPSDNNTLISGNDGGIQKADITNSTVTWTPLNNDYVTYQYYHADISPVTGDATIAGGAQDNGTTINTGGTSFSSVFGGDGVQTGIISAASASSFNIICGSQSGNLIRATGYSGGVTSGFGISPTGSSSLFVTNFQLDPDNTNHLYYASATTIYRTRNASGITSGTVNSTPATNWELMTALGFTGNITCFATSRNNGYGGAAYSASDANRKLYAGTASGRVYRLNDPAYTAANTVAANITPTGITAGYVSSIAVNPWDDNEIMVTYANYAVVSVWHTTNANSATPTWTAIEGPTNTPLELGSARSSFITKIGSTTTYNVGNSTGLYTTQALSGATTVWEQVAPSVINYAVCASMRLRVSDNRIVLGTHGNGMYELQLPAAVAPSVTVTTNPTGRSFSVDGTTYTSAQNFNWAAGSTHTIATTSPQEPTTGTRYTFNNWSDAGSMSHTVTAGSSNATYTANFNTTYLLTTETDPCGTIAPATAYMAPGAVQITATPTAPAVFNGFTGGLTGTTNPQNLTLSAPTTVRATFTVPVSVALSAMPGLSVCAGTNVTFTATPTNGGATPQYKWFRNNAEIGGQTGSTYSSNSLANGDVIKVEMISNQACAPNTAVSDQKTLSVGTASTASVGLGASPSGAICLGTNVTFTATPTNGGPTPQYVWYKNNMVIGGASGNQYSSTTLANGDVIKVEMATSQGCATPATTSAQTTMTVNPSVTPGVGLGVLPNTTVCQNTQVTFTATPTNGGATPQYKWFRNNVLVNGVTGNQLIVNNLTNGEIVKVELTSSITCASGTPAIQQTMTVTPAPTGSIVVLNPSNNQPLTLPVCSGTGVLLIAPNASSYLWSTGAMTQSITVNPLTNTTYSVQLTNGAGCSGTVSTAVTVIPSVVSSNPAATTNSCPGGTVTLTASATGSGNMTVRWETRGPNDAIFTQVSSAAYTPNTTASYTTPVLSAADNGRVYRAVFVASCSGQIITDEARVTMSQGKNIPDASFAAAIRRSCPTCIDDCNNLLPPSAPLLRLEIGERNVTSLAGIENFTSLRELYSENNKLTELPANLPPNLRILYVNGNQLTSLPNNLPNSIQFLNVQGNKLTSLPTNLPSSLLHLYVYNNQLTSLPEALPAGLSELHCFNNQLRRLPANLPNGLRLLYTEKNPMTCLPAKLPAVAILRIDRNRIACLPQVINLVLDANFESIDLPICNVPCSPTLNRVRVSAFAGQSNNIGNELSWQVQNPTSNVRFEVQYSPNGQDFATISTLTADDNNTVYQFTDKAPQSKLSFYRLKINELGVSEATFSAIIKIQTSQILRGVNVYPNPVLDVLMVANEVGQTVEILNAMGQVVVKTQTTDAQTPINVAHLQTGIYFVRTGNKQFKVLKQ